MTRFISDERPMRIHLPVTRVQFYREEFLKHQQVLQQQREYYSDHAITNVEAALSRILSQLEVLCTKEDADQVVSVLLRKFDLLTGVSAWSDPKNVH
jgi:hypothetical protein